MAGAGRTLYQQDPQTGQGVRLPQDTVVAARVFGTMARRRALERKVPFFDPHDGGIHARILFLLEAPGPQAVRSGFISRDNPDPSARNLRLLLAPLPRHETVLWNIVPWYVGTGQRIAPVSPAALACGRLYLEHLIRHLPAMVTVVLVGKTAQRAREDLARIWNGPMVDTCHPSNRVFNRWPDRRSESEARIHSLAKALAAGAGKSDA